MGPSAMLVSTPDLSCVCKEDLRWECRSPSHIEGGSEDVLGKHVLAMYFNPGGPEDSSTVSWFEAHKSHGISSSYPKQ